MTSFFFYNSCNNFSGGFILSAYLRQFFKILKMWGFEKSESWISSIYFLYWLISDYLANPLERTVSITLKRILSPFKILIRFPYLSKQPIYEFDELFTDTIWELNLIKAKLFKVIYFGILKFVLIWSK